MLRKLLMLLRAHRELIGICMILIGMLLLRDAWTDFLLYGLR